MLAFGLFSAHSAYIRYHEAMGQRAFDVVSAAVQHAEAPVPDDSLHSAIHHLTNAREWGLFRPLARDHQLASLHLKNADPSSAEPYLRRIAHDDPEDADSRLALTQLLQHSARLEEAEIEARAVIADIERGAFEATTDQTPDLAAVHALLGEILAARGKSYEAIGSYQMAAAEDPTNVPVRMALGRLLADSERYLEAAAVFREASSLRPDLSLARYNLAVALAESGDDAGAIEAYRETLALSPDDTQSLVNLGFLFAGRGDLVPAAEHFQRAVEIQPDHAQAHFNLGVVHQRLGDRARAEVHYQRAVRLDPSYAGKVRRSRGE